jgi:hypothetical protein
MSPALEGPKLTGLESATKEVKYALIFFVFNTSCTASIVYH